LSVAVAQETLGDLIDRSKRQTMTPEGIVSAVADHYQIDSRDLLGKSQTRSCSLAPQVSMYPWPQALRLPFTRIGDIFDRNHSTVMASVRQIQEMVDGGNQEVLAVLRKMRKRLNEVQT